MKYSSRCIGKATAAVILAIAVSTPSFAEIVSEKDAYQTAVQFLMPGQRTNARNGAAAGNVQLSDAITLYEKGNAALYVFNLEEGGYVIVSAEDGTNRQVLGWSDSGSYDPQNVSSPMQDVLDGYVQGISRMRRASASEREFVNRQNCLRSTDAMPDHVDPLLGDIEWGQDAPYNRMTPELYDQYTGEMKHCPTGCVNTAIAQVMKYHEWPAEHGNGIASYDWRGQTLSVDLSQSVYRWDLMLPNYRKAESYTDEQADAVAILMRDIGYVMHTIYKENESGAGVNGYELVDYFDYDRNLRKIESDFCTKYEWENALKTELADGRPVLCSGGSKAGGHEYVCDGYNTDGLFHYNFGWDGTNNGWFASDATGFDASPSLIYGISRNHGGTGAASLHSKDDFIWTGDNNLHGALEYQCIGLHWDDDISFELALAVENVADGTVTYFSKKTTNYSTNVWNDLTLNEEIPDGTYKVYPVGRIEGEEWQTFFHNALRQLEIDLTVANGEKIWTNHILEPIENGAVEIGGCYYLLDEENGEATLTFRNGKYNSYSGNVTVPATVLYNDREYAVTAIGERAFEDCQELVSVHVGENVRTIGFGAFGYDNELESVTFAEGSKLTVVDGWAFNGCYGLEEIVLPEGTEQLNMCAFQSAGIRNIVIPESVYYIATGCFAGCSRLKSIHVNWTSLEFIYVNDDLSQDGIDPSEVYLFVPVGYVGLYEGSGVFYGCNILEEGEPLPVEKKAVYLVWVVDGMINPSVASATLLYNEDKGVFEGDFTVPDSGDGYGYVYLATALNILWNIFVENVLGAFSDCYHLYPGMIAGYLTGNDACFQIDAGTHHIIVNTDEHLIYFDWTDGVRPVSKDADGLMFDLSGRPVTAPVKGQIIIRNGQKAIAE